MEKLQRTEIQSKNSILEEKLNSEQNNSQPNKLTQIWLEKKTRIDFKLLETNKIFENFYILGVDPKDVDKQFKKTQHLKPRILYQFVANNEELNNTDLSDFCFPSGAIRVKYMRRSGEICIKTKKNEDHVFLLNSQIQPYYCFCVYFETPVEKDRPLLYQINNKNNLFVAPICVCIVTKYPNYQILDLVYSILKIEYCCHCKKQKKNKKKNLQRYKRRRNKQKSLSHINELKWNNPNYFLCNEHLSTSDLIPDNVVGKSLSEQDLSLSFSKTRSIQNKSKNKSKDLETKTKPCNPNSNITVYPKTKNYLKRIYNYNFHGYKKKKIYFQSYPGLKPISFNLKNYLEKINAVNNNSKSNFFHALYGLDIFLNIPMASLKLLLKYTLLERNIIFISESKKRRSKACLALVSLIQPFQIQCIYAPILPEKMVQLLIESPVPFIFGVKSSNFSPTVGPRNEILIYNLDTNKIVIKSGEKCQIAKKLKLIKFQQYEKLIHKLLYSLWQCEIDIDNNNMKHLDYFTKRWYQSEKNKNAIQNIGVVEKKQNIFNHKKILKRKFNLMNNSKIISKGQTKKQLKKEKYFTDLQIPFEINRQSPISKRKIKIINKILDLFQNYFKTYFINYRKFIFLYKKGKKQVQKFDKNLWLASYKKKKEKLFFQEFSNTQMFDVFIENLLDNY
ncbi:suppression of tumorigenicity 5 st5 [Anaeramoeba flamelloides]|uniref:Suppression of tumorigenicity 5 st5 n=1 Tax=Anaeramoeba flamelloides TaxID=1746091 RepID=A0ABQ8Y7Q4_9EUKA|nr:suppression of tumorigenicity 5 st5 [Anaeramoeba flamelloides]